MDLVCTLGITTELKVGNLCNKFAYLLGIKVTFYRSTFSFLLFWGPKHQNFTFCYFRKCFLNLILHTQSSLQICQNIIFEFFAGTKITFHRSAFSDFCYFLSHFWSDYCQSLSTLLLTRPVLYQFHNSRKVMLYAKSWEFKRKCDISLAEKVLESMLKVEKVWRSMLKAGRV